MVSGPNKLGGVMHVNLLCTFTSQSFIGGLVHRCKLLYMTSTMSRRLAKTLGTEDTFLASGRESLSKGSAESCLNSCRSCGGGTNNQFALRCWLCKG